MKTPILYSFIRFLPFQESGEFVNIGLLMCEPKKKKLTYKLVKKNDARVNHFFHNSKIFNNVHYLINDQLKYITKVINVDSFNSDQEIINFFNHYTEEKNGLFQFSNSAISLVENPEKEFNNIYTKFIKLAAVPNENKETLIIKGYKSLFKHENNQLLMKYKEHKVQGDIAKFSLPLALKSKPENDVQILKAIKPLAFDQSETPRMIEHCDTWISKINRADEEGLLRKEDILFTLGNDETKENNKMFNIIKKSFDRAKIQHLNWDDNSNILLFAKDVEVFN